MRLLNPKQQVMWKTINRIRRKPKAVRNRYAFLMSATITSFIALVWLASMWAKFNNQTVAVDGNSGIGPFSELKDKFGGIKDLIGESFNVENDDGTATGSDTLSKIIEEIVADDYGPQGEASEVSIIGLELQPEVAGGTTPTSTTENLGILPLSLIHISEPTRPY